MKFVGKAVIVVEVECESEAIALKKFERDMRVNNYGVNKTVIVEPRFEREEENIE